ncbi:MAG: TRAP transporter substrate-binding protein [Candidatus Rokubacteria bacterium]|nr:TRAP transporter substrate-binding protein [Candidatus Rokubacteria bacterium]
MNRQLTRRTWLKQTAGAIGLLGLDAVASPRLARASKTFKARLGHGQATTHPLHRAMAKFAELAKDKSKGRLDVGIFPGSQLGGAVEMAEAVRLGTIQFTPSGNAWIEGVAPMTGVVNLPALFRDNDHAYKAMYGFIGKEVYEKSLLPLGVRPLGWVSNEFRHVTNNKRPIKTLADMKGLKIRVPNSKVFAETVKAMGGNPVPVDWAEVFGALQQGVVDGQENPFMNIYTAKLYEVQKHLALTSHMWDVYDLMVNEKFFQSLDAELQKVVLAAGREACDFGWNEVKKDNADFLSKLKAAGMQVTKLDGNEVQAAVKPTWKTYEDKNGAAGRDLIQRVLDLK